MNDQDKTKYMGESALKNALKLIQLMTISKTLDLEKDLKSSFSNQLNEQYQQCITYTNQEIAKLIGSDPTVIDTINRLASTVENNSEIISKIEDSITKKANQAEMDTLLGLKLEKTGDTKDNIISFTEASTLSEITSGEKHSSIFGKLKLVVKNFIPLLKLMGTVDISAIGDGTVTGAINSLYSKVVFGTITIPIESGSNINHYMGHVYDFGNEIPFVAISAHGDAIQYYSEVGTIGSTSFYIRAYNPNSIKITVTFDWCAIRK